MSEHIFLTGKNAEDVIAKSIVELVKHHRQLSRCEAFEDCTKYWKDEIKKIVNSDESTVFQLMRIMDLFGIDYPIKEKEEDE